MEERLRETEDGNFEYTALYPDSRLPPSFVDINIPVRVEDDRKVAHCEHMEYYNARRAGELLEEKGYDVEYPDPPIEIRLYRKAANWFGETFL